MSRLFVCTDYHAVLRASEGEEKLRIVKSTCCFFDIEVEIGEGDFDPFLVTGMERYTGNVNWLSVYDGRAAFGATYAFSDHIIILPLPSALTTTYLTPANALCLPTAPSVEVSCLVLTQDALFTIWGYKQHTLLSPPHIQTIIRNAIRIVWFDARQEKVKEKDRASARSWTLTDFQLEYEEFDSTETSDEEDHEEALIGEALTDEAWFEDFLNV
ncbi:hypothetical protein [Phaffia rhodozyma]|uniref:Uncharacterized protein n=1 Tax=Phaffia rhodozyma TaxID=264483 RepID=A0A0F7SJ70_PHARH|nr:hypothetical protein [Phaffia rhodozyma]